MATTAGDIYVRSGTTGAFTKVDFVQGGWITVPSSSNMTSLDESRLKDGQIVWVESDTQLYVTRKFVAYETPGYGGTDDSSSFHTTNLGISGGGTTVAANPGGSPGPSLSTITIAGTDYQVTGTTPAGTVSSSAQIMTALSTNTTNANMIVSGSLTVSGSLIFTGELDGGSF